MNKKTPNFLMRKVLFLSAIFFIALLFSCKKDGKLTPDFDNGNLSILFTDTFSLKTSVVMEDSLRTDLSRYNLLGLYNDPIFGPVSSSIYTELLLTGVSVDFGNSTANPIVIDSVVLNLKYQGLYGDTLSPMTVEVYELSSAIDPNTYYYSSSSIPHKSTALSSVTFVPNTSSDLRIKLANSFGDSILANAPYANNTAFSSLFKGLYITVKDSVTGSSIPQGSGSIVYFNMNTTSSKVTMYYHQLYKESQTNGLAGIGTQQQYDFIISEARKFSHFEHNYIGTDIIKHISPTDPTMDTTVTYVSTMAGVKTKIEIPNIKELAKNGTVIINKAELVVTIENGSEGLFDKAKDTLSLVGIDASGASVFLPDFNEGIEYYGGILDQSSNTYTFNISRHINELIYNTPTDYGMYLIANGASISANRVVLGSEKNLVSKIKLNITYSKI